MGFGHLLELLAKLTVTPGMGSNSREGMVVCKCIVPSKHGGTLNSRPATSNLVRLVEGEERWEALTIPGYSPSILGGTELNRTVTCKVFRATANDRLKSRSPTCLRLWQLPFLLFGKDKTTATTWDFRAQREHF
ncbi:uncharacterized protein TNCV_3606051 [Trichonephila clavipes]|uniref:Uncharacterized protein n=1 Tax=Trichonephila clavipes TaxID=2585209 RepID=A0A8X6UW86_TRICX|nr:uncharacterized protein TNCV_3606051 [Trichonephila clavipes]